MTALSRIRPLRRTAPLALAAAVLLALPGCSSGDDAAPAPAGAGASLPGSLPGSIPTNPGRAGDKVDACALLEPAEVRAVLPGAPAAGEEQGTGYCTWEDPATYDSVTVRIGSPGTAIGGKLGEPEYPGDTEQGPAGIRFTMGGSTAEFVAGDRACDVQLVNGKDVKTELVTLVGKVKSRVTA